MASEAPHPGGFMSRIAEWRRAVRGDGFMPLVELLVVLAFAAMAVVTWRIVGADDGAPRVISPPLVAVLLVANLVPALCLIVLIGRRLALRRARKVTGSSGRLHVRLVALFSVLASVPVLALVIFSSLLFQYGVEFWFSDKARGMLENASILARQSYQQTLDRVDAETVTMAGDLTTFFAEVGPIDSPQFPAFFGSQVYQRNLSEGAIVQVTPRMGVQTLALVNPYDREITEEIDPRAIAQLRGGKTSVVLDRGNRIAALTRLQGAADTFVYAARVTDQQNAPQTARAEAVLADYRALIARSRSLQLRFNAALMVMSLLIVAVAVWIALNVADRFVRPVGELVDAARRVAAGDLAARVPTPRMQDEIGTLATDFNRMTRRLEEQTGALVAANANADSRRALIEAVMSGVSAGIISVGPDRRIRLINSSALELLRRREGEALGAPLKTIAPELDRMLDDAGREGIVELSAGGEALTFAVKVARDDSGLVLTFDDMTQQLLDQRRAAWSDVARRIAHEIKNPLTPIQLAAERLKRRYGGKIEEGDTTFARLTDTIVRQVGDLRRMVDEFSSFARMPKPMFREESLLDIVRQSMFLHEVAHPGISFTVEAPGGPVPLVCDRRQLGQAITNIVKNAVEAIGARPADAPPGAIEASVLREDNLIHVRIADNGTGLPADRERLVEPYMTTRAKGTGLGLAIVKKIVEEHFGRIELHDRPGGGTIVELVLDPAALAANAGDGAPAKTIERTS